jgi:predicted RNA methylase
VRRDRPARPLGPARDAFWQLARRHLNHGARVADLGAGNCDELPLDRIADQSREVPLIDLDRHAVKARRRPQPRSVRRRIGVIEHDVTNGAADAIAGVPRAPPFRSRR